MTGAMLLACLVGTSTRIPAVVEAAMREHGTAEVLHFDHRITGRKPVWNARGEVVGTAGRPVELWEVTLAVDGESVTVSVTRDHKPPKDPTP